VRRRLVSILCATPLALCLLLCWASFRGGLFGVNDGFVRDDIRPGRLDWLRYGLRTRPAGVEVSWRRDAYPDAATFRQETLGYETRTWGGDYLSPNLDGNLSPRLQRLGFDFGRRQYFTGRKVAVSEWALRVPWWVPAVLMLLLHVFVMARGFRAQRGINWRRAGRCGACGYDLRASADRCSECGAPAREARGLNDDQPLPVGGAPVR
jgi:hypothetical protein